ncbi:MAG TPA: hypothetical protein VGZ23_18265 [bacterium]|nr:hypothetical protein [bacterium]
MSVTAPTAVIPSILRIHRQLRVLDRAYMDAESKPQIQNMLEAKFQELQAAHDLLPSDLRDKSWILQVQGYTAWGKLSKS